MNNYNEIEKALTECPMTYVPALLKVLIGRCRKEPIFNGWMGMQSFISRVYKQAGTETHEDE